MVFAPVALIRFALNFAVLCGFVWLCTWAVTYAITYAIIHELLSYALCLVGIVVMVALAFLFRQRSARDRFTH